MNQSKDSDNSNSELQFLRKEQKRLHGNIEKLLARMQENQSIQQRFYDFEFKLLGCGRLEELLNQLLNAMLDDFALDGVSLVLFDRDYSVQALLDHLGIGSYKNHLQLRQNPVFFDDLYGRDKSVILGPLDVMTAARILPGYSGMASAALVPLVRQGQVLGSLHLGAADIKRFTPDKGADFIAHMGSVVAVCLENCLGRERMLWQGQIDPLTQVNNRRHFDDCFTKEIERSWRSSTDLACLFIDIDHFKQINDQFGHQMGDLCLKKVASCLNDGLRKTDLLARFGGEEFVVLLPSCPKDMALETAERLRKQVEQLSFTTSERQVVNPTASIGVALWRPQGQGKPDAQALDEAGHKLLAQADQSMYQAKQSGRNQVCSTS